MLLLVIFNDGLYFFLGQRLIEDPQLIDEAQIRQVIPFGEIWCARSNGEDIAVCPAYSRIGAFAYCRTINVYSALVASYRKRYMHPIATCIDIGGSTTIEPVIRRTIPHVEFNALLTTGIFPE